MTAYGKQIVVLGGEPSTATREATDLATVYVLDTGKIRYPNDQSAQPADRIGTTGGRPSISDKPVMGASRGLVSREGSIVPDPKRLNGPERPSRESLMGQGGFSRGSGQLGINGNDPTTQLQPGSKLPRASIAQAPQGPPPQQAAPAPRSNGSTMPPQNGRGKPQGKPERSLGSPVDNASRNPFADATAPQGRAISPVTRDRSQSREAPLANGRRTPTLIPQTARSVSAETPQQTAPSSGAQRSGSKSKQARQQGSVDSTMDPPFKSVSGRASSPPPPTRQTSNPLSRKGSARNSQTVAVLKELDVAKNRNAWYASELELARKAGYVPNPSSSPMLDQRAAESFDDEDKPLIEALLAMKAELSNVQGSIDKQAVLAAKQIAEVEKQRDTAINEAIYAKARLAAHSGSQSSTPQPDSDARDIGVVAADRSTDISKKLAAALSSQRDLQNMVRVLTSELEAEKRARALSDDTATSTQTRMTELETYKQQNASEVERLKAELHELQIKAREDGIASSEAVSTAEVLRAEKEELESRHKEVLDTAKDHSDTFESLRDAISSSAAMRNLLERKLDEERAEREKVEGKLSSLKAEHENRTAELETATRRLRDTEELAEQHANEAKTHKQAILAGLDKVGARDIDSKSAASTDRVVVLQGQIQAANALARKYQTAADTASEKLRSAEERIAGLEAYQEQASREGMSIRKQLQSTMREIQTLQAENSDLKHQLANQQLETNAVNVQHNTLKDILVERGISPSSASRGRGLSSPDANAPDPARFRELEQQLAASTQAHEELKAHHETREQEAESTYREKLTQLESDYQSAVHYVKGTEKMLKRMKDELAKYKTDNARMKEQLVEAEDKSAALEANTGWEKERSELNKQIEDLHSQIKSSVSQLEQQMAHVRKELAAAQKERDELKQNNEETRGQLNSTAQKAKADLAQLQEENAQLEHRAQDAEQKVSLLLDQVEHSVDNYRRQSHRPEPNGGNHQRNVSAGDSASESSVYEGGNRNSMALDSLANELETLRTHWETTNKNYRLSTAFDFEDKPLQRTITTESDKPAGLSPSVTDWRKRLDAEEKGGKSGDTLSPGTLAPNLI